MSESFQSLLFPTLSRADAAPAEKRVTAALQQAGIVGTEPAFGQVYGESYDAAYAPTDRFTSLRSDPDVWSEFARAKIPTLDISSKNGVGVRVGFGINGLEFNLLDDLTCPVCMAEAEGRTASDLAGDAATNYFEQGEIPDIECPSCGEASDARDWVSSNVPGFAYLAYEFWNWPDLQLGGWTLDIPALMRAAAGGPIRFGGAML